MFFWKDCTVTGISIAINAIKPLQIRAQTQIVGLIDTDTRYFRKMLNQYPCTIL